MEKDENQQQSSDTINSPQLCSIPRKIKRMCSSNSKHCFSRKRNDLTIDRKLKIIEEFTNGVQINVILKKFNINQSHLSSIIRRKAAILQDFHTYGRKSRKRIAKRTRYAPINEEVFRWLMSLNCHVSGSIIQNKARMFSEQLKITGFRASNGWLECFRKKYNIHSFREFQTNSYITSRNINSSQLGGDNVDSSPLDQRQLLTDSTTNNSATSTTAGAVDTVNNQKIDNGYNATSTTSNDSLISSVTPKSPVNYYQRPAQASNSNSNKDTNSYSSIYHQPMSSLLNTPIVGSSNVVAAAVSTTGNDRYKMENANSSGINSSREQQQPTLPLPPPPSSYHSDCTENIPIHYLHNTTKPSLPQSNVNTVHDIYGYHHPYPNNSQVQVGSKHYNDFIPTNSHRFPHDSYQNTHTPTSNEALNIPNSYETNRMFYHPMEQAPTAKNNFSSPATHMTHFMNEFNDMNPPPPMHGNFHTPNTGNSWNGPLANLPSYPMDINGNSLSNPSLYYPRTTTGPNDNTTRIAYPYNPNTSRNHPPQFHPNQRKDFY